MKISLDWMKELVAWDDDPQTLAVKLTAAGLNVEGIEEYEQSFPGVVVARVVHREKHPDADRLSLCRVDDGSGGEVQVVCGAPNVREGLTVLFGRVGAVLPGDFQLKKTKIRGVESHGMICSASELRLSAESDGIMELDTDLPPGTSADELFGYRDTVLDIEVTPNRPDWLNHVGIAREIAAIYGTKVSLPRCWSSQQSAESIGLKVQIEDYGDCPRYTAFAAKEVKIGPSPRWMQNRLRAVGSRPINNVVDITNYVMLEMGQPMHAFDQARLRGELITVRRGRKGDKVVTLDDQERQLAGDHLLVCDGEGPVALAGVMGLANSEVTAETTSIILESAFFSPSLVREASRALNLVSESSYRFERGADWGMVEKAAHRALYLMQEHAGARIVSDWAERSDPDYKPFEPVRLRTWQVNRVLGTELNTGDVAQMLQNLGLKVQPMGNAESRGPSAVNMMVEIPTFRRDLLQEVDLIEEVARCHGYDNLDSGGGLARREGNPRRRIDEVQRQIRSWFSHNGYQEMVTSSFFGENDLEKLDLPEGDRPSADPLRRQPPPRRRYPPADHAASVAAAGGPEAPEFGRAEPGTALPEQPCLSAGDRSAARTAARGREAVAARAAAVAVRHRRPDRRRTGFAARRPAGNQGRPAGVRRLAAAGAETGRRRLGELVRRRCAVDPGRSWRPDRRIGGPDRHSDWRTFRPGGTGRGGRDRPGPARSGARSGRVPALRALSGRASRSFAAGAVGRPLRTDRNGRPGVRGPAAGRRGTVRCLSRQRSSGGPGGLWNSLEVPFRER